MSMEVLLYVSGGLHYFLNEVRLAISRQSSSNSPPSLRWKFPTERNLERPGLLSNCGQVSPDVPVNQGGDFP